MTSTVRVELGPVPSTAAQVWLSSTLRIFAAISAHPELVAFEAPKEVSDTFTRYLLQWLDMAERSDVFRWTGSEDAATLRALLTYWVRIDQLSDDDIERLGVSWSPPDGQPFFEALTSGVIEAIAETPEFGELAAELAEIWGSSS